jgi:hypothetical protein
MARGNVYIALVVIVKLVVAYVKQRAAGISPLVVFRNYELIGLWSSINDESF